MTNMTQEAVIAVLRLGMPVYCWAVDVYDKSKSFRKLVQEPTGSGVCVYGNDGVMLSYYGTPQKMFDACSAGTKPVYRQFTANPEDLK